MKKLSEFKNEDAIDLLADIIEPVTTILSDSAVVDVFKSQPVIKGVQVLLKSHKHEVLEILARMEDTPVEEYECSFLTLPIKIMQIISDKDMQDFFKSQFQSMDMNVSGSVTENIEGTETN